jgi:uncharacterized membrane protein YhiD involved in acid resistance
MEDVLRLMLAADSPMPWQAVLVSMLLAFAATVAIAVSYILTYRGLSYSRTYVQSLVLGGMVAAALMLAVGNNLARGIGILGTLAIVRFRSTLKDPRDLVFLFASLGFGIAMGVRAFAVGLVGTAMFCATTALLAWTEFGSRQAYDGLARLELPSASTQEAALRDVLERHCRRWVLVALREAAQGERVEHSYQVKLKDPDARAPFVADLEAIPGARAVSFYWQEATMDL